MNTINYNFSNFEDIMTELNSSINHSILKRLRDELNKFFKDSQCREVLFTKNTDKLFFGMCVIPMISGDEAMNIIASDDKMRVKSYYLEIDSKLLEVGFSSKELVAIILHEVGHMVNTARPIDEVRNAIDIYMDKNNTTIKLSDANQYKDILAFAIRNTISKINSLFEIKDEEIIADEFSVRCGYGSYLESAYNKLIKNSGRLNRDVNNKLIVLQWTLRLYTDVKFKRIRAIHTLQSAKKVTASELQNREMNIVVRALQQIDDDILLKESLDLFKHTNEIYKRFKYKGMRTLEEDLYEIQIRIKNVDVEDEALMILRQINMRLSLIDDYVTTEKLSESEIERWWALKSKYLLLREELSKKTTYQGKYYGLFVQSPIIKSKFDL